MWEINKKNIQMIKNMSPTNRQHVFYHKSVIKTPQSAVYLDSGKPSPESHRIAEDCG